VGLGATAIAFAPFLPRGLWGTLEARLNLRFLPVGYVPRETEPKEAVPPK
jgi:branched-chain amino acid transport system permease protein